MENLLLSCIESRVEKNQTFYGRFQLGPFDKGQSLTVANALRRTLLSELYGFGISHVKIEGTSHEYSTLKGIRESILEILLNLKEIVLTSDFYFQAPQIGYLYVQGPGIITAKDLKLPSFIQCVDCEQYIATLSQDGFLKLKFLISQGKNYCIQSPDTEKNKTHMNFNFKNKIYQISPGLRSWTLRSSLDLSNIQNNRSNSFLTNKSQIEDELLKKTSYKNLSQNHLGKIKNSYAISLSLIEKFSKKKNLSLNKIQNFNQNQQHESVNCESTIFSPILKSTHFIYDQKINCDFRKNEKVVEKSKRRIQFIRSFSPLELVLTKNENSCFLFSTNSDSPFIDSKFSVTENLESITTQTNFLKENKISDLGFSNTNLSFKKVEENFIIKEKKKLLKNFNFFYTTVSKKEKKIFVKNKELKNQSSYFTIQKRNTGKSKLLQPEIFLECRPIKFFKNEKRNTILPLDSNFMPVNKVNFVLEPHYELEQLKEKIILEIWTNGSIHPRQAIHEATYALNRLLLPFQENEVLNSIFFNSQFSNVKKNQKKKFYFLSPYEKADSVKSRKSGYSSNSKNVQKMELSFDLENSSQQIFNSFKNKEVSNEKNLKNFSSSLSKQNFIESQTTQKETLTLEKKRFAIDIGNLDLSLRPYTCLKRANIHTIGELLEYSGEELLLLKNFGKRSLEEIEKTLFQYNLKLRSSKVKIENKKS
jgi:DNA-directed RNA polymerase alpha subunit